MSGSLTIERTAEAYETKLTIGYILRAGVAKAPDQEIIYADMGKYTYRDLERRVAQLANLLTGAGVKAGQTVAVMDWDSHRYLEAFLQCQ